MVYTLGTSHRTFAQFLDLFREHGIETGVDIRSFPTSRYPHFSKEAIFRGLTSEGIQYVYLGEELGGFRKGGYLNHMESASFKKGMECLERMAEKNRTAFFCSERFPWRCHRRWVADALMRRGWKIIHIIERGTVWIPKNVRWGGEG